MKKGFEPKIVSFLCNWCAYAAADLAGVSRFQYPPNIRNIRVMCSGRVDPLFILRGLAAGYDGIMVCGWLPGECHYLEGNLHAENKMNMVKALFDIAGVDPERLRLEWVAASEGTKFAEVVTEYTENIKKIGHFDPYAFNFQLEAMERTLTQERIRWLVGLQRTLTIKKNAYGEKIDPGRYSQILHDVLKDEYLKSLIYLTIREKPMSVREIDKKSGIGVETISSYLTDLEATGEVSLHGYVGRISKYISK